jgi:hypothetical protein
MMRSTKGTIATAAALCALLMLHACKSRQGASATEKPVETAAQHPSWVDSRPVTDSYYIGIGYCPKSRPDFQETAKKNALNDLSSEISVTVEGNSLLYTLDRKYKFDEEFTSTIRTSTKERLEGYELVDSYDDADSYWVYYRLDKAEYARRKAERKQQALDQATDLYKRSATSLAGGDLKNAFDLDLRALIALKDYWGENDQVMVGDRNVPLANELFNDLQKMTSGVRLAVLPERCALGWANRFRREMLVSATFQDNGRSLVQLPLEISYPGLGGAVKESRNTDSEGHLRTTVQRVDLRASAPEMLVRLDLDALASGDLDPGVTKALLGSLTVPEVHVPIDLTLPKVFVKSTETNLGAPVAEAPLALALKNELTAQGFRCVDREADADLAMELTASTRETGESNGFYTVALDNAIKVRDRRTGDVVYAGGKQGLKGIQLSYAKAGLDAYKKAATEVRTGTMPALVEAVLQH